MDKQMKMLPCFWSLKLSKSGKLDIKNPPQQTFKVLVRLENVEIKSQQCEKNVLTLEFTIPH